MSPSIHFVFKKAPRMMQYETIYIKDETSFLLATERPTYSLMLGHHYLSIEIDCETQQPLGLSGFFRLDLCRQKSLKIRESEKNRVLKVISRDDPECGIGYDYILGTSETYDSEKDVLFLGEWKEETIMIGLCNKVSLGFYKNQVICIQVKGYRAKFNRQESLL